MLYQEKMLKKMKKFSTPKVSPWKLCRGTSPSHMCRLISRTIMVYHDHVAPPFNRRPLYPFPFIGEVQFDNHVGFFHFSPLPLVMFLPIWSILLCPLLKRRKFHQVTYWHCTRKDTKVKINNSCFDDVQHKWS